MRIISHIFLRKFAYHWIFNSKILNYHHHLKYRSILCDFLKKPYTFNYLKMSFWFQCNIFIFFIFFISISINSYATPFFIRYPLAKYSRYIQKSMKYYPSTHLTDFHWNFANLEPDGYHNNLSSENFNWCC
jgi:hypothetical protein